MSDLLTHPCHVEERAAPADAAVSCGIAAVGVVRAAWDEVAALRLDPGPVPGAPLPAGFLKHSDEQTVVGLAAVLRAIRDFGLQGMDFTAWGVLAAPRYLGRVAIAEAMHKIAAGGAWKASPLVIPHRSLHSVSGTVTLALRVHGPNFGAGGGLGNVAEGLLTALSILDGGTLPGLWLLLTGWNPEPVPDREGRSLVPTTCLGVALALGPADDGAALQLQLSPSAPARKSVSDPNLPELAAFLASCAEGHNAGEWSVTLDGITMQLTARP